MGKSYSKASQGVEDPHKTIVLNACAPLSRNAHVFRASAFAKNFEWRKQLADAFCVKRLGSESVIFGGFHLE
jgi:hypothetical protein